MPYKIIASALYIRGHSSVVEHPTADRIVPGSNPGAPLYFLRMFIRLLLLSCDWFIRRLSVSIIESVENWTFYSTGSRFFARLPLTFVTHSPARCSLSSLCYILDTHLFNFPSNCFVSNVSLSRDKTQETRTFCLNRNGFLIRFHQFLLSLRRSFCFNFCFFRQRFQNKNFWDEEPQDRSLC